MAPVILVMGVSGAGKTTLGQALARRLGLPFLDADDLHPQANRDRMAAGIALDDADRAPWLDAVAQVLAGWAASGSGGVTACSALKRTYRDRLRRAAPDLIVVFVDLDGATLADRLARRRGHYFDPVLLDSQLETLEPPGAGEVVIRVDGALPTEAAVQAVADAL